MQCRYHKMVSNWFSFINYYYYYSHFETKKKKTDFSLNCRNKFLKITNAKTGKLNDQTHHFSMRHRSIGQFKIKMSRQWPSCVLFLSPSISIWFIIIIEYYPYYPYYYYYQLESDIVKLISNIKTHSHFDIVDFIESKLD